VGFGSPGAKGDACPPSVGPDGVPGIPGYPRVNGEKGNVDHKEKEENQVMMTSLNKSWMTTSHN